jgi:hypothetical protein
MTWYQHPQRFPKNAVGPFYTLGHRSSLDEWCGQCLACEAPEAEAPELLAPLTDGNWDTYFVRQPETQEEVEHACTAIEVCCVTALRYGGTDQSIIHRLGNNPVYSDYIVVRGKPIFVGDVRLRWWSLPLLWLRSWLPTRD